MPALQGDDIDAVAKTRAERFGVPVIPVDCAGFYGNKNLGNRIAGDAVYQPRHRHARARSGCPRDRNSPAITRHDVNLIGEWNVGGEFWNVAPLFDELGLRVLCSFSGDSPLPRSADHASRRGQHGGVLQGDAARRAQAGGGLRHAVVRGQLLRHRATPPKRFAISPACSNDPDLTARTEALIAREEARVEAALAPIRDRVCAASAC